MNTRDTSPTVCLPDDPECGTYKTYARATELLKEANDVPGADPDHAVENVRKYSTGGGCPMRRAPSP